MWCFRTTKNQKYVGCRRASHAELAQVMVEVFVHEDGPLVGSEAAEEAVGMGGAAGGTGRDEAVEECGEASLLGG